MKPENIYEKINQLLDYKELLSFYELEDTATNTISKRDIIDQLDCDIDFFLHLSLEEGNKLPLLN